MCGVTIFSEREASPLAPWRIVLVTRRTPIRQLATRQRYSAVRRRHLIGANANAATSLGPAAPAHAVRAPQLHARGVSCAKSILSNLIAATETTSERRITFTCGHGVSDSWRLGRTPEAHLTELTSSYFTRARGPQTTSSTLDLL